MDLRSSALQGSVGQVVLSEPDRPEPGAPAGSGTASSADALRALTRLARPRSTTDRLPGGTVLTTWHEGLFQAVGRWSWLRRLDDGVSGVVLPLYDRHRDELLVELMHGGRWAGHSVHAALSDLPIGLWSGTLLLDLLGQDVRPPGRRLDAAGTLNAAGLLAALATAATGMTDWSVSDGEDRRVGLFHGLLNLAGTTLQGASLAARLAERRRPARALSATGLAVVAVAGYVGGHLVQGRAVMVSRVATHTGPGRWVRAIAESDLPEDTLTGVDVEGRKVLLHRSGQELAALDDVCSHAGGRLSRGSLDGCAVECPLHGSRFDLRDGRILRGPAAQRQPVLPARLRNGWIEVRGGLPRARRSTTQEVRDGMGSDR